MKRVQHIAWPIIGLGAVAVSFWLLAKELHGLSLSSLREAIGSISPGRWILAIASTLLAYIALAGYDRIALLHLGRRISWRFVGLASFTAYAIAHNIGASVLSGAVIRDCRRSLATHACRKPCGTCARRNKRKPSRRNRD